MKLRDEFDTPWVVMAHDPASSTVNNLKRIGFDYIVLPRYTYKTGIFPTTLPQIEDFIAHTRMYDCRSSLT